MGLRTRRTLRWSREVVDMKFPFEIQYPNNLTTVPMTPCYKLFIHLPPFASQKKWKEIGFYWYVIVTGTMRKHNKNVVLVTKMTSK